MTTTSSGQQVTDSLNGKLTFEQDKNRIVGRDENNLIRLLILANGIDFRMKVSEEGHDVLTTTDDHIVFDSGNKLFKIVDVRTIPITHTHTVNSARTTTVAHGQPGRPLVVSFANNLVAPGVPGSPSYQMPFTYPGVSGGNLVISTLLQCYVDDDNFSVYSWSANATTITADIKYYVLAETAN